MSRDRNLESVKAFCFMETWRNVLGFENLYLISDLGNIKSIKRNGTIKNDKIIKGSDNGYGYKKVILSNKKKYTKYIHILVAEAFLNYKTNKGKICVDHINNNKYDNRLENLQIITPRENVHRIKKNKEIGVYEQNGKFRSIIYHNKKSIHLGYFKTKEEALEAYNNKLNQIKNER